MLTQILLFATLLGSGRQVQTTHHADMVELNHHHDYKTGKHSYDQVIFWEWSHDYKRYDVVAWTLVNKPENTPTKDPRGYRCEFDGKVVVYAKTMRESWTVVDPERSNQRLLPSEKRLGFKPEVTSGRRW